MWTRLKHTVLTRIRAPAAIVFKYAIIQAEAHIVFWTCLCKNIVHPSKNMSTYGMKFAFLLKDNNNNNNNKACHRICTTFIAVFMHNIFINQARGCCPRDLNRHPQLIHCPCHKVKTFLVSRTYSDHVSLSNGVDYREKTKTIDQL